MTVLKRRVSMGSVLGLKILPSSRAIIARWVPLAELLWAVALHQIASSAVVVFMDSKKLRRLLSEDGGGDEGGQAQGANFKCHSWVCVILKSNNII